MPRLEGLPLKLDVDAVLRAQAADPPTIRARQPGLVEVARQALKEGLTLLEPRVVYTRWAVVDVRHTRVKLAGGMELKGNLVVEHLGAAREVVAILCTVGDGIENRVHRVFPDDPVLGLALDGVGGAAVEALSVAACRHFEQLAEADGVGVSVPLSPGLDGWPVEEGQPQVFNLLPADLIGVRLTESCVMRPAKSLTLVLGLGPEVNARGTMCDYCAVRNSCRYRGSHP